MNRVVVLRNASSASVVVFGALDVSSAPDIVRRIGLLAGRYKEVHIDLGNVGVVDALGMTMLRHSIEGAEGIGARVVIVCQSDAFAEADVA